MTMTNTFTVQRRAVKSLNLKARAMSLTPELKPFLTAAAIIAGLLMANTLAVYVWRAVTCNC